ncbi:adenylate/guanylate cyclase domain-containing protein [Microvirga pakistanensis]|uniref:adenylate/guanylate cyclase domain-containing protein n=1 Tax=Microvirga pakistanensis TaxID=1682650 RepID=UPI00106AC2A0|nr:adenylate/guanylate cyclase domain-containing protein [Microvirga pakistanensis]
MTDLERWIVDQGLRGGSVASLFTGFAEHITAEGIPLARAYLALPTVNPTIRVVNHTWTRQIGAVAEGVSHDREVHAFEESPFGHMLRSGRTHFHWHLNEPGGEWFGVFDEVRRAGGKDYLARLIRFENASAPDLRGIATSFSTYRDEGFLASEVARIDAVLPLLALAAYRMTLLDLTVAMLDTYVGLSTGRRVLSGEIRRGSGTTLTAALLFADLRGFTAVTDAAGTHVMARLNRHLEAMAEPVVEQGGEVMKFLGDGLLAVFPITEEQPKEAACAAAIRAAREALARNKHVNRSFHDETPLGLDIALHTGEVFYGNIGAANRLDFTVIGPAVNEVSRMEALCSELDCPVVLSSAVAAVSPVPVCSLGHHRLRGVPGERELFTFPA